MYDRVEGLAFYLRHGHLRADPRGEPAPTPDSRIRRPYVDDTQLSSDRVAKGCCRITQCSMFRQTRSAPEHVETRRRHSRRAGRHRCHGLDYLLHLADLAEGTATRFSRRAHAGTDVRGKDTSRCHRSPRNSGGLDFDSAGPLRPRSLVPILISLISTERLARLRPTLADGPSTHAQQTIDQTRALVRRPERAWGRLVQHGRQRRVRLPMDWPWRSQFMTLLTKI